jgi:hypothetical protein
MHSRAERFLALLLSLNCLVHSAVGVRLDSLHAGGDTSEFAWCAVSPALSLAEFFGPWRTAQHWRLTRQISRAVPSLILPLVWLTSVPPAPAQETDRSRVVESFLEQEESFILSDGTSLAVRYDPRAGERWVRVLRSVMDGNVFRLRVGREWIESPGLTTWVRRTFAGRSDQQLRQLFREDAILQALAEALQRRLRTTYRFHLPRERRGVFERESAKVAEDAGVLLSVALAREPSLALLRLLPEFYPGGRRTDVAAYVFNRLGEKANLNRTPDDFDIAAGHFLRLATHRGLRGDAREVLREDGMEAVYAEARRLMEQRRAYARDLFPPNVFFALAAGLAWLAFLGFGHHHHVPPHEDSDDPSSVKELENLSPGWAVLALQFQTRPHLVPIRLTPEFTAKAVLKALHHLYAAAESIADTGNDDAETWLYSLMDTPLQFLNPLPQRAAAVLYHFEVNLKLWSAQTSARSLMTYAGDPLALVAALYQLAHLVADCGPALGGTIQAVLREIPTHFLDWAQDAGLISPKLRSFINHAEFVVTQAA